MEKIKSLKNLEELKKIQPGETIGVGQAISKTIPAICINNDGAKIRLLGKMDNQVIVEYKFPIEKIGLYNKDGSIMVGFYEDRNIITNTQFSRYIKMNNKKEFDQGKESLINGGIWK